jgi:VIT1/CCC1 family predicted Fe2+/Mn2+ transporter
MKHSLKTGISFGFTSGIITTLGLIVGLHSTTGSRLIVIGGILLIAISDSLSDAMGIHISEESEHKHSEEEIWESTIATFLSKFIFSLTFVAPVLLFPLTTAVIVCVVWGFSLITVFSIYMAMEQGVRPYRPVLEHLFIAIVVVVITHYVGDWVATFR